MVPLTSACVQTGDGADPKESNEYVTGSNLPHRDRQDISDVRVMRPESMDRTRAAGVAHSLPKQ